MLYYNLNNLETVQCLQSKMKQAVSIQKIITGSQGTENR